MSDTPQPNRVRKTVRGLFAALDRFLAAAKDVERARDELHRDCERQSLRVVPADEEGQGAD